MFLYQYHILSRMDSLSIFSTESGFLQQHIVALSLLVHYPEEIFDMVHDLFHQPAILLGQLCQEFLFLYLIEIDRCSPIVQSQSAQAVVFITLVASSKKAKRCM